MKRTVLAILMIAVVGFMFSGTLLAQKGPGVVVLKGSPMGGVKFNHTEHSAIKDVKCEMCHHAAKAGVAMKAAQQKCQDCHVKTPVAPMKTNTMNAFHAAMAKGGLCADCHAKSGGEAPKPSPCTNCHKKANV
jgi:hypothetical protein